MGNLPKKFWQGSTWPLRIGFLGFVVAAIGALLGFAIDYGPDNIMAYIAFSTVFCGISIGFVGIIAGMVLFFRAFKDKGQRFIFKKTDAKN